MYLLSIIILSGVITPYVVDPDPQDIYASEEVILIIITIIIIDINLQ